MANKEQRPEAKKPKVKAVRDEKRAAEVAEKVQQSASRSKMGKMGGEKGEAGVFRNMVLVVGRTRPDGSWSGKARWVER